MLKKYRVKTTIDSELYVIFKVDKNGVTLVDIHDKMFLKVINDPVIASLRMSLATCKYYITEQNICCILV